MRVLLCTHSFKPRVGGLETVAELLASEFVELGHEVKVVTWSPGKSGGFAFEVIRKPSPLTLLKLLKWCDVLFHNHVCLKAAWPLVFVRRPWVVVVHTWIPRSLSFRGIAGSLKHFLLGFATCVSISKAIAEHLSVPSLIIPDPFDDTVFREMPSVSQNKELVFLGRLVSDKGLDLLLEALAKLKARSLTPSLTVIGTGPEEKPLKELATRLGINTQVHFVGEKTGKQLAKALNQHKILVVPSRWREPFGLAALEGIACGCVAIGSNQGGLKEAIGKCGLTFPNNDAEALTEKLYTILSNARLLKELREDREKHLARHKKRRVAKQYIELLESIVSGKT